MQNPLPCGQKEHSARTITGVVTGLQPSASQFVTPRPNQKNAIVFLLARAQALPASVPPVTSNPPEVTGGTPPGPPAYSGAARPGTVPAAGTPAFRTGETRWPVPPLQPSPPQAGDGSSGNFA